jgi:biopolymer transport protein ExbB
MIRMRHNAPHGAIVLALVLVAPLACAAPAASRPVMLAQAPVPPAVPATPVPPAISPAVAPEPAATPVAPAPTAEDAAPIRPAPAIPRELSPWSMFMSADTLVKAVMVSLAFASLVTWTLFLAKSATLSLARRRLRRAMARTANAATLTEAQLAAGRKRNALVALIAAAFAEMRLSPDGAAGGIQSRAASRFADILRAEARAVRSGMGVLATIGATAPFVGLFGTVWGIMNSFIGISKAQTTNLAVVAPGIAEALLATAIGLAAAIPAVIIYNHFSRATRGYLELLGRAAGVVGRLLSRELERNRGAALSRRAE